jgi:hypothetical protein
MRKGVSNSQAKILSQVWVAVFKVGWSVTKPSDIDVFDLQRLRLQSVVDLPISDRTRISHGSFGNEG